ncbi:hypothetical protein ACIA5H_23145 [Nocardia sp. NPDC051900]|uniref:hypothetical protein n=1 Tax=Nocardia sp. NPDC051900 TaxID=3364326 RepID=UPI00379F8EC4
MRRRTDLANGPGDSAVAREGHERNDAFAARFFSPGGPGTPSTTARDLAAGSHRVSRLDEL